VIFIYISASLLGLFIFVLAVPIEINFSYKSTAKQKTRLQVGWLFGLLLFDLKTSPEKNKPPITKTTTKATNKTKANKSGLKPMLAILQSEGFVSRFFAMLRAFLSAAEFRDIQFRAHFGFHDPADTGQVYGLLSTGFALIHRCPRLDILIIPVFDRPILESSLQAGLRITPIKMVWAILSFAFSPVTFRALRAAMKAS